MALRINLASLCLIYIRTNDMKSEKQILNCLITDVYVSYKMARFTIAIEIETSPYHLFAII